MLISSEQYREKAGDKPYNCCPERGGVLLLTMVLIAFLSLLVLLYIDRVEEQRKMDRPGEVRASQEHSMQSGLEIALAALNRWRNTEGTWIAASEEWARPIQYLELENEINQEAWPYEIVIQDLGTRIPFISLSEEDLTSLFRNVFRNNRNFSQWLDRLLDWMDEDDLRRPEGAEYREYGFTQDDALRLPPNRPIRTHWEWDFFLSHGLEEEIERENLDRLNQLFHFYPITGINLNSIDPELLEILGEAYQFDTSRILNAREQASRFTTNRSLLIQDADAYVPSGRLPPGLRFTSEMEGFRITVRRTATGEPSATWLVLSREPNDEESSALYRQHPSGFFIYRYR